MAAIWIAAVTPAASAQSASGPPIARPNQIEVLAHFVQPAEDPLDEVYGDHTGVALRYARRIGSRFGLAAELGQRSASGSTPITDAPAELDVTHAALTARWHFRRGDDGPWDPWLGAGFLYQSVEETVRFPDGTASGDDSATGPLLGLGLDWTGRSGWGFGGEVRLTRLAISSDAGEDVDLDALEVLAGLAYSF